MSRNYLLNTALLVLGVLGASQQAYPQDDSTGIIDIEAAADRGAPDAEQKLGELYLSDKIVIPDYRAMHDKGVKWLSAAGDQGNVAAQKDLGFLYSDGRLMEKDEVKAAYWYHKAADQGDTDSEYKLAEIYALGTGVSADIEVSTMWLKKAAEGGNAESKELLVNGGAQLFKARREVIEALHLAEDGEPAIAKYYLQNSRYPKSLSSVYKAALATNPPAKVTATIGLHGPCRTTTFSSGIAAPCSIMATMLNIGVNEKIAGKTVAVWTTDGGNVFHCGPGAINPVPTVVLPQDCRDVAAP